MLYSQFIEHFRFTTSTDQLFQKKYFYFNIKDLKYIIIISLVINSAFLGAKFVFVGVVVARN